MSDTSLKWAESTSTDIQVEAYEMRNEEASNSPPSGKCRRRTFAPLAGQGDILAAMIHIKVPEGVHEKFTLSRGYPGYTRYVPGFVQNPGTGTGMGPSPKWDTGRIRILLSVRSGGIGVLAGRVDDIRDQGGDRAPDYPEGPRCEDILQKNLGTCWFSAVLCAITRVSQDAIKKRIISQEAISKRATTAQCKGGNSAKLATFRITTPRELFKNDPPVHADVTVALADVMKLDNEHTSSLKSTGWWVAGFEQAPLKKGFNKPLDEFPKEDRTSGDALWMLTGKMPMSIPNEPRDAFLKCDKSPVVVGTFEHLPKDHILRWAKHVYTVISTSVEDGVKMVHLYDPFGHYIKHKLDQILPEIQYIYHLVDFVPPA
ncbi:uncharacterized protein MKK02DRAFT_32027 [Dioszegia hungarica]|uniref:Calpain catalytic domain-containing protein n=1 Tax=Dioszegia hungarica TaxID=4972 RepID=A0AA38LY75_9TREE|nr:uncharacterized protein MKK02DRAFT_32027 [Dioszegia hungarica]KAI9638624.1 hypothetical protein MKK02DRAFT_32027 [Dioszegia hungarica]